MKKIRECCEFSEPIIKKKHIIGYKKKPFIKCTLAEMETVEAFGIDGHTWNTALKSMHYATTEKEICRKFIEIGFGDVPVRDFMEDIRLVSKRNTLFSFK